jgi:hypothetical protein
VRVAASAIRPSTVREYAERAGFTAIDVLPIEGFGCWRFYRLRP